MSRNIRVSEPSAEMQIKIIRAKDAMLRKSPGLSGVLIADIIQSSSFEDTRGHVQTKMQGLRT